MLKEKARKLINNFKDNQYIFGLHVLEQVGKTASEYGKKTLLIANQTYQEGIIPQIIESLEKNGICVAGDSVIPGAKPNSPREDVYRIGELILHFQPDMLIALGGGSTIDCVKASNVLASFGSQIPEIESFFGTGLVSKALNASGKNLKPFIALQTSASSAAHLTKYSNITDIVLGQKKLIVDDAIVPHKAIFDYSLTTSMPLELTIDGALDGISHTLEVFYGISEGKFHLAEEIASTSLELIFQNTNRAINNPDDLEAREAIGLATDLGGYAIMIGGTNGAHLTSFSLVDIASHGRACGIMNPYYTVFFAPAIERQLKIIGKILQRNQLISLNLNDLSGRELGIAIASGLIDFNKSVGAPTTLKEIPGFTEQHIKKALEAAKEPQLEMKLKNMPVPLNADLIDEYMAPVLEAAKSEDFSIIKNLN